MILFATAQSHILAHLHGPTVTLTPYGIKEGLHTPEHISVTAQKALFDNQDVILQGDPKSGKAFILFLYESGALQQHSSWELIDGSREKDLIREHKDQETSE